MAHPVVIDTHCHLTHQRFTDDADEVIRAARAAGVAQMITISTGLEDGDAGAALVARHPGVLFRACGLDPFTCHEREGEFSNDLAALGEHLQQHACVALGEIGLEYFHKVLPPARQQDCLHQQLALAHKLALPVVIHVRDAHADMKAVLAEHPRVTGVIHSFDGSAEDAADYVQLGWYISVNGMSTFKKKPAIREAVQVVPEDRLLFETDSPFLSPEPVRGRRCEPAYVCHVLAMAAAQRQTSVAELAAASTANARRLFALPDA